MCNGDSSGVDKGTGCPDGSTALDLGTGGVHLVWDWNVALGDSSVPHAGLGHSYAPPGAGCLDTGVACPGEFVRSARPLNDAVDNTPLDHGFVKLYAGTIFRRKSDWLIISAIGGGSWGLACITSPNAAGPYTHPPTLLLWPQSDVYHPGPTEVSKHDEFCINNEELCIKNEEICIKNEELCINNEGFRIKHDELLINNDEFCRPTLRSKPTVTCTANYKCQLSFD